jgi:hypothetical protein
MFSLKGRVVYSFGLMNSGSCSDETGKGAQRSVTSGAKDAVARAVQATAMRRGIALPTRD